jgi:hypothetical protein
MIWYLIQDCNFILFSLKVGGIQKEKSVQQSEPPAREGESVIVGKTRQSVLSLRAALHYGGEGHQSRILGKF